MIAGKVTGAAEAARRLEMLADPVAQAVAQTLHLTAEQIMAEAKGRVPVRDGPLRASGFVAPVRLEGTALVSEAGFALPYALVTHENPRAGKTGGISPSGRRYKRWAKVGEWKFLETPFKAIAPKLGERLRRAVAAVTARGPAR